jgi:hypothetical protein
VERNEPTHGDILRAIGTLEGKLDTIHQAISNNRADIIEAFRRLNEAEKRIAQGVIVAVMASIVMPLLVTMAGPRLEFGPQQPHHPAHQGRAQ